MKKVLIVIVVVLALSLIFSLRNWSKKETVRVVENRDTIVVFDTIRDTILVAKESQIVRSDTVWLKVPGDTVFVQVEVPIARKVYLTTDYKAIIEGFNASLVDMEIYRKTQYVTDTKTQYVKQKWGLGIHVGYGYGFNRFHPYIGVGVQYNLFSW